MAEIAGNAKQTSVQRAAMTSFLRLVFSTAATKFLSSHEFIDVRSMGFCSGKTACNCGIKGPLNVFAATVVRIVGTLKILAVLARPKTLLIIVSRFADSTPKNICG